MLVAFALTAPSAASSLATRGAERAKQARIERRLGEKLLVRINRMRTRHGARVLHLERSLSRAAEAHVRDMGRHGYFGHATSKGVSLRDRVAYYYHSKGYSSWTVGEDLLWSAAKLTSAKVIRVWMRSSPHRANLLALEWRQIGISAHRFSRAPGFFGNRRVWLVAVDFGSRR